MTTPGQPGWYDDPQDAHAQRYWDGQDWTPHRQRKSATVPAQPPVSSTAPPPSPNWPPPAPPSTQASSHTQAPPPPQTPPSTQAPPPPQAPPPAAPRASSRAIKIGLVLAGLALVLAIAALVASRVALGNFLPGIALVAAIAILAAVLTFRSHRSVARKALVVTAIVLVVAVAVPASLKVVFPAYDHFFGQKSAPAPQAGPGGSSPGRQAPPSGPAAGAPKSGILVMSGDGWDKAVFGYVDPSTGKYSQVSSFNLKEPGDAEALEISPDLTRYATLKADNNSTTAPVRVGWIDTGGKFTAVSPAPPPPADFQQSAPPTYSAPVFDGAGNFYYWAFEGGAYHLYKVPAGSTSNPQQITPAPKLQPNPLRNIDGTLNFQCPEIPGKWLGSDGRIAVSTTIGLPGSPPNSSTQTMAIVKYPLGTGSDGCPYTNQSNQDATKIFDLGIQNVSQPVASPDATKIAFYDSNSPGGLYVVGVQPGSTPTRIAAKSDLNNLPNLKVIRWN